MNTWIWIALIIGGLAVFVAAVSYFDSITRSKNDEVLAYAVAELSTNSMRLITQVEFLRTITARKFTDSGTRLANKAAYSVMQTSAAASEVQAEFFRYLKAADWASDEAIRERAYKSVLELLLMNSEPRLKQFALQIARWHYGLMRTDRRLTIYDEQAIQNDLNSHTQQ